MRRTDIASGPLPSSVVPLGPRRAAERERHPHGRSVIARTDPELPAELPRALAHAEDPEPRLRPRSVRRRRPFGHAAPHVRDHRTELAAGANHANHDGRAPRMTMDVRQALLDDAKN